MKLTRRTVLAEAGSRWHCRGSNRCLVPPRRDGASQALRGSQGNGVNENHWGATGSGDDMKLSLSLSPLEPLRKKVNVVNGLFNKHSTGQGIHPAQTGSLLSGAPIQRGPVIHAGITVDQMIANHIGQETLQPDRMACGADDRYPRRLLDGVQLPHSWQKADNGAQRGYPALAGDTGSKIAQRSQKSIMDRVRESGDGAADQLDDQHKLDEQTSVREVERADSMRKIRKSRDLAKLTNAPVHDGRPENGLRTDFVSTRA